jgi:FkbM family methyltransferase
MRYWFKLKHLFGKKEDAGKESLDECITAFRQVYKGKEVRIVFDVGAHEGKITQRMNDVFEDASVYAFEPFPDSYKKLLEKENLSNRVKSFQVALSSQEGDSTLFVNSFSETNSLLPSNRINSAVDDLTANIDEISIETSTLDIFCSKHKIDHIDLLKLDTQGSELKVLEGGDRLLRSQSIKAIYCEVEFVEIYQQQPLFDEIFQYLKERGYYLHNFYNLNSLETGRIAWADALFLAKDVYPVEK